MYPDPINEGGFIFSYNESFYINSLLVDGILLTDGSDIYYPDFTFNNIDRNESYFWVDSSNRLRYELHSDNNELEYLQIEFDIDNLECYNYSLFYQTYKSNVYFNGYFRVDYDDSTSTIITLPNGLRSNGYVFPQFKTIDKYVFLITDNDLLNDTYVTGYINNLNLNWVGDKSYTFITGSIIDTLFPLIVFLMFPILIYTLFKKKDEAMSKKLIIPMFLLSSVILLIMGLIEFSIFFLLMIFNGALLYIRRNN